MLVVFSPLLIVLPTPRLIPLIVSKIGDFSLFYQKKEELFNICIIYYSIIIKIFNIDQIIS